jgi:hypothetical protein
VHRRAGTLADAHRVAAPARRRVVDPGADLVLLHAAALGERFRQLVRALGRHGDCPEGRVGEPFQRILLTAIV